MESKYKFAHPVPPVGVYKLSWVERFTPDGGGAPVDVPQTYTWDGTTPSGYKFSDPTTWPSTKTFEVDLPGSNGSVSISDLTYTCSNTATPTNIC